MSLCLKAQYDLQISTVHLHPTLHSPNKKNNYLSCLRCFSFAGYHFPISWILHIFIHLSGISLGKEPEHCIFFSHERLQR